MKREDLAPLSGKAVTLTLRHATTYGTDRRDTIKGRLVGLAERERGAGNWTGTQLDVVLLVRGKGLVTLALSRVTSLSEVDEWRSTP